MIDTSGLIGCDYCEPRVGKLARRSEYEVHGMCSTCAERELTRLRGIEGALKGITDLPLARPWHVLASIVREAGYRQWTEIIDAIADALEPPNG